MSVILSKEIGLSKNGSSAVYIEALLAQAEVNDKIVCLDADLGRSCGSAPFGKSFPERYFDVGIAESNMVGIASGLSNRGYIPFTHTFAPFAVRRCLDQIYISGSYSKLNIKIVGSAPGILATATGGTHMPFDDLADMLAIPEMMVVEPSDDNQLKWLIPELVKTYGMCYVRFDRKKFYTFYEEGSTFELGKAVQLRDGKDVTIIAAGSVCLNEAMKAAALLADRGIQARVLDMFTIKPIDEEAVIKAARETGAIVTAENANELVGMGALVAHILAQKQYAPLECIGSHDRFGEVGNQNYLIKAFQLSAEDIAAAAERAITRK